MAIIENEMLVVGADAMKSQFEIVFPKGIPGGGNANIISLRMDETMDPPEEGVQIYEIFRKGQKIPLPGGAEETDKTFTVNVRLDQNWIVYDDLDKWKQLVYNKTDGTPGGARSYRTDIEVRSINDANIPVARLVYQGCFLGKIKVTELDNQSQEPLKLECTFYYARFKKTR